MVPPERAAVEYLMLGQLVARRDGVPVDLGGPLPRALLALLLTEVGRPVTTDRIVDELWGDAPPTDPEASVQTYVYRLRRVLTDAGANPGRSGAPLERVPQGYRLAVPLAALDVTAFEEQAMVARRAAESGDPERALTATGAALALWRGDLPLADCGERPFLVAVRARWAELRLACIEDRASALVALGRPTDAIADLEELTAQHPLRERPWALLMMALHTAGRPAEALDRYHRARTVLDAELGLEPGAALRELQARILRGEAPAQPTPPPGRGTSSAGTPTGPPLVGRDAELAALVDALDAATLTGAPRFALVTGEPGIGKTRLVAELTARSGPRARVVVGRCHEDPDTPALWPWREVLAAVDAEPLASGAGAPVGGDGLFALFDDILHRLLRAAGKAPLVVVLDDLHWADTTTLRLLAFLAVELRVAPVLVVAACRPEGGPQFDRTRAVLARTPGFVRVDLGPLDLASTAALVGTIAIAGPSDAPDEGAVAALHARAGGNPFFVTQLARLLAERPSEARTLPAAVRDVVRLRLAGLDDEARDALALAAVAGDTVDPALVLRATCRPTDAAAAGLDHALAAGLLRVSDGGSLAFTHALVRETVLADQPDLHRRRLHARLAAALPAGLSRAQHMLEGRPFTDVAGAVEAAEAAASESLATLGYEAAAEWYSRALAVLTGDPTADPDGRRRAALALGAGSAWALAGNQPMALATLAEAVDVAHRAGDPDTAARAASALGRTGGFWLWVPYGTYPEELLGRLQAVLDSLDPTPSPARVRVLATLASGSHYAPDRSTADRLSAEAVAMARSLGDSGLLVEALTQRLFATWGPDNLACQTADADELVATADDGALAPWRLLGLMRRAVLRVEQFDLAGADDDLRSAWDLTQRRRLRLPQQQLVQMQAARASMAGELDVAERLLERAAEIGDRTQLYLDDLTTLMTLAFVRYEQGRLDEVLPALAAVRADGATVADASPLLAALVLAETGRSAEAADVVATHRITEPQPAQWDWLAVQCWTAVVVCDVGDAHAAGALLERLLPHAGLLAAHGGIGGMGPVTLFAGRCALVAGRIDEAEALLRSAAAACRAHELRPALARALLWLATAVHPRDAVEAQRLAGEALEVARGTGMRRVALAAERLLDSGP